MKPMGKREDFIAIDNEQRRILIKDGVTCFQCKLLICGRCRIWRTSNPIFQEIILDPRAREICNGFRPRTCKADNRVPAWSICQGCVNWIKRGGDCCGGAHYYPNECESYDDGNDPDPGPDLSFIVDDVERHEAELNYDGGDWW